MLMKRPISNQRKRKQRGSALVELAISLMGFLLLTMGAMEFSWAIFTWHTCVYAGQRGARWASTQGSQSKSPAAASDVIAYVKANATAVDTSKMTITPCWYLSSGSPPTVDPSTLAVSSCNGPSGYNTPGSYVWVNIKYDFKPLAYLALKETLTFSTTAQVVINN